MPQAVARRAGYVAGWVAIGACNSISGVGDLRFVADDGASDANSASDASTSGGGGDGGLATGGGGTGAGGTGASSSSSAATSSTASGSGAVGQVSCTEAAVLCAPGQICCFHETDPTQDHCAASCTRQFIALECDGAEDCRGAGHCCATVDASMTVTHVECGPCTGVSQFEVCNDDGDCSIDRNCGTFPLVSYPGYGKCNPN